jgi:hypothetical protein
MCVSLKLLAERKRTPGRNFGQDSPLDCHARLPQRFITNHASAVPSSYRKCARPQSRWTARSREKTLKGSNAAKLEDAASDVKTILLFY